MMWPVVTLDYIKAKTQNALVGGPFGSNLTTRDYRPEGVPVIRGKNLANDCFFDETEFVFVSDEKADELSANNAKKGDLLFTQRGTLGQVGLISETSKFDRYVVSQSQMKLTVDRYKADPYFIYFYFCLPSTQEKIKSHVITSGVPHINLGILREIEIPLPPISDQVKIAQFASQYNDLIVTNQRRIQLLEESARLLYREWFVKLRFPGHETVPIKDGVPEGWHISTLENLAEIEMGQSPESKYYNEEQQGLPFHQGVTDFEDRFVSHRIYTTHATRYAEAGDIVCSVRAPVGRLNITLDKIAIGRGLSAFRSKYNFQSLLFYQMKNLFFREDLIGGGAIFASVGKKELYAQEIIQPIGKVAQAFENICSNIDKQIEYLTLYNRQLKQSRDLLLPKLMSGALDVSQIRSIA